MSLQPFRDQCAAPAQLLQLTFEHMTGGILILGEDEVIEAINDNAFRLFNFPVGSVRAGDTLSKYLTLVGREAGWADERTSRVIENHRL